MVKSKTTTVTREEEITLRRKLDREEVTRSLEPAEELALRMLHGVGVDPDAPLPSKAPAGSEAERALLAMEADILAKMRKRQAGVQIEEAEETEESEPSLRPTDSRV
ncbi:MAG: hypothetical protein ACOCWF_06010, partial [Halochromatium sp.]